MDSPRAGGVVVISGGSAANSLVDIFTNLAESKRCSLSYIIPISDNGGSSSELIRVFGGPGIGDLRSRLIRLIPEDDDPTSERNAIKAIFNHRLPASSDLARLEWLEIVEARHPLWKHISPAKKELIRSFLNLVNLEIVKRARPSSVFNFAFASIGNLFLTGARVFSGSLESAIYLLSTIGGVPQNIQVIPAINSNFSHHISAGLADGSVISGQNDISHPSVPTRLPSASPFNPQEEEEKGEEEKSSSSTSRPTTPDPISPTRETEAQDRIEDATLPGSLPTLRKQYLHVSKATETDLPARIQRIWYINPYGQEIRPPVNPKAIESLRTATSLIYSIGSLYTSILPCVILRGVGDALASAPSLRHKILILNGSLDRETGPARHPFSALDFVAAVARAGAESRGRRTPPDEQEYRLYVTHVIYVEGEGAPVVDRARLLELGIECVRVYGRRLNGGGGAGSAGTSNGAGGAVGGANDPKPNTNTNINTNINTNTNTDAQKGARYDPKALSQALEAILGKRPDRINRRMTIEHM
ncbi:MAG: hypothetical protein M1819_000361 [Sarea resinae]|nr:MAG: hypothetical protein M1819_000361 [Sarea resinae]